jgi:hypothetical protein
MTNNNKNNIDQQNNNASNFDDFVFNPKSTKPEPKRKPDVNIEKTDFKDYDSILKCDCCQKAVGFFSMADLRPYIDSPMFLCIDCLRTRDRADLSDEAQVWFEDER